MRQNPTRFFQLFCGLDYPQFCMFSPVIFQPTILRVFVDGFSKLCEQTLLTTLTKGLPSIFSVLSKELLDIRSICSLDLAGLLRSLICQMRN
jgi:hypothetical protein